MGLFSFGRKTVANPEVANVHGDLWDDFLEHTPVAIALMDENGAILRSNPAFRKIAGVTEGRDWNLANQAKEESGNNLLRLLSGIKSSSDEGGNIEVIFRGNEGKTALLYLTKGKISGHFMAFLIDTTEQKNLEQRFVQSQKMQAIGQLAGGVAHDFNNLLTAMIGFCDLLLQRHQAGDQSFADIMQIRQNAHRAASLVRQLLAFSRQQTLQPKVLDVTDVIAELAHLIRRLIGENITLNIHHGQSLWKIKADQGQLEQVIINLAVNARDAMQRGGTLSIKTWNISINTVKDIDSSMISSSQDEEITKGDYVVIEVSDTGHGMPRGTMQKIFEPFFTTKKVGEGTGLGLSTVYGIIKQTGGYIYVSSTEGVGTNFYIFLKRYKDTTMPAPDMAEKKEVLRDLTGNQTILLVEDEDPVRIFGARAMQNKGYKVIEADSAEAALDIVGERGGEIDLIITDVVMPGMSGPEMVRDIKKKYPEIKVIFVSGYAEEVFIKTYGSERDFNFLPKPYTLQQLAEKVKDVIEH